MPDNIYFQWQNEILKSTIYPLREMKLRDFLIFYKEIDIWAAYKDKTLDDVKDEVESYRQALTQHWAEAYDRTQAYKEQFTKPDAPEDYRRKYPDIDPELHRRSTLLHNTFKTYFPRIRHVQNERYFLAQRISEWEITRKWVARKIDQHQRNLRNMPENWVHRPRRQEELDKLEKDSLPMADEVLEKMYDYLSAMVKIEKRRVELKKWKDQRAKDQNLIKKRWEQLLRDNQRIEKQHASAKEDLERLINPPDLPTLETYFNKEDVESDYQARFGGKDPEFLDKANQVHRTIKSYFKSVTNPGTRAHFLRGQINQINQFRRQKATRVEQIERDLRNMPATWSRRPEREQELQKLNTLTISMVDSELKQLTDYLEALTNQGKNQVELTRLKAQKEKEFNEIDTKFRATRDEAASLESEVNLLDDSINRPEKEQLLAFLTAQPITVNDIAAGKIDEYRQSLMVKDQYELLELIIKRFEEDPQRYPLWLQYMVIHFSGMRYKSAHGSWADPKDLLLSLRIKDIEAEIKRAEDEAVEALCEEKLAIYEPESLPKDARAPQTGPKTEPPGLAKTEDRQWLNKIDYHVRGMQSASPYRRRQALMNLRIDETDYEIEQMSDQDALAGLEEVKDDLPGWMWNEIVRLTDLRLKEVTDKNWETLTAEEQEERWEYRWREFREIMDKWKKDNLTGWREEHDRANRLIVTRAVCNEVAEHIQHLRGNSPPGGLTAKPEWYLRKERDPKLASGPDKPFLIKPKSPEDFKAGASLLWLRFVHGKPNPWRIAHPVKVRGEGLLSPGLIGGGSRSRGRPPTEREPGSWRYNEDGGAIRRQGQVRDAKGNKVSTEQWLRWIHEATVAEVAETAEGTVVLTFETALPYEDKRQSTIGIFKHHINAVRHSVTPYSFIASFVGYTPPGEVPYDDLRDMLDWNKVLLKDYTTDDKMNTYRNRVGLVRARALGPRTPVTVSTWLETAPVLDRGDYQDLTLCYQVDPENKAVSVYEPEVPLKRGTLLKVSQSDLVRVGDETYYPVTECTAEPRALDLYVRKSESIDITQERQPSYVQAKAVTHPYRLVGIDDSGTPVFEETDLTFTPDIKLRVSSMHQLSGADAGDGVIHSGQHTYHLVTECFARSSLQGLFVRTDQVVPAEAD